MVVIAVPGGTGGIGRTIIDAITETGSHKAIALSRKAPKINNPKHPIIAVDYSNVEALVEVLEANNVETVISAIFILDDASKDTEINVIRAAEKSKTTKRFIISNWGITMPPEDLRMSSQRVRLEIIEEIRKTNLEWTQFSNGFLLDYYGMPFIESHMSPLAWVADMTSKTAVIPGTGDEPITLTYTRDLARFVAAVIDLPRWEEIFYVYGETITWNSFVKRAEEVTGTKFKVTYDDAEKLKRGEATEMPPTAYPSDSYIPEAAMKHMQVGFGLFAIHGYFAVPEEKALNKRFPQIKTLTVEEVLQLWKGERVS